MPELLTVKELALHFKKAEQTIQRWLRDGLFPHAKKVKGGWYVPRRDLD